MAPRIPGVVQQVSPGPGAVTEGRVDRKGLKAVRRLDRARHTTYASKRMQVQVLFRAVEEGEVERVKQLVGEGLVGPGVTRGGCTLLHAAAAHNQPRVALFLLQLINPNVVNREGHTPAHLAAMKGHTEVLAVLLADPQLDHHKRGPDNRTYTHWLCVPLFDAVLKWNKIKIQDLLSVGADPDCGAGRAVGGALVRELRVTTARQLALALGRGAIVRMFENRCAREEVNDVVTKVTVNTSTTSWSNSFHHMPMGSLRLRVAASTVEARGPGVYKMDATPRGYVCILSYNDFKDRPDLQLEGSQADTHNLASVFSKMGYSGHVHYSLTAEQTRQELARVRDMEVLEDAGCAIFVISSHGASPQHFLTSDMKHLDTHWVLDLFKDSQCPRLKNKPKLFIWDLCRGYYGEEGSEAASGSGGRDHRVDEPLRDVMCLSSSNGGFTWYTVTKDGTPFTKALCRTLAHHAHDKELGELYREFLGEYAKSSPGTVPQLTNFCFNKKFYFSPEPEATLTW